MYHIPGNNCKRFRKFFSECGNAGSIPGPICSGRGGRQARRSAPLLALSNLSRPLRSIVARLAALPAGHAPARGLAGFTTARVVGRQPPRPAVRFLW